MNIKCFACILFVIVLPGCYNVKHNDLIGSYEFLSNDVQEDLELNQDGVFIQKITIDGSVFSTKGEWSIEPSGTVKLRSFLVRFDSRSGGIIDPPQNYATYIGYWDYRRMRLDFDESGKYYLNRKKQ